MRKISIPAVKRLCMVYRLLKYGNITNNQFVNSVELGDLVGDASHNIRKDIGTLENVIHGKAGYEKKSLVKSIETTFSLNGQRNVCVVGLGNVGISLLQQKKFVHDGCTIVAGFDSDVNKIDTIKTDIPLYPSYEITDMVKLHAIDIAMVAVPKDAVSVVVDRLLDGGIRGILNFSPTMIKLENSDVCVTNMNVHGELATLSALIHLKSSESN